MRLRPLWLEVEHLTLPALADKVAVIEELCRSDPDEPTRRFAIRGYLPGWYSDDDVDRSFTVGPT